MSNRYVINKNAQSDGYHEVHNTSTCSYLPNTENQINLGYFNNCSDAIRAAKNSYPSNNIDGCYYCCNACHTR